MSDLQKRPNVLFIMADQFRGDIMSCVGGPARTPNLDLIAKEGIVFTQCSTNAPLCVPARIGLFTGKYAHTTGAWDNLNYILATDANVWTKQLRDLGYSTSLFGKTHIHGGGGDIIAREPMVHAYGFDIVDEITGPHASGKGAKTHMTEMWREKGLFDAFRDDLRKRGKFPQAYPSPLPFDDYYDVYVGNKGNDYLESYDGDKPWFCHVSFGGPHEPWDTPEPYSSMYDPKDMPPARPPMKNAFEDRPRGITDKLMTKENIHCSPEVALDIRADYCGGVTLIDDMIGKLIDTIKKRGEWDNTVILFTSDHGEMNGDQGFVNKRTFLDGALNVPLIIRTPETVGRGGLFSDALVSLIDVGPTLIDIIGGSIDYVQFGRSLCGVIDGSEPEPRKYVISELSGEMMYMDKEWKAMLNAEGKMYMLFDRKNDKEEQFNLAGSEQAREIENMLNRKILSALFENQCLIPAVNQQHTAIEK